MPDGKSIHCKECKKQFRKEYANRYPNEIKARKKKYVEENRDKVKAYLAEYREHYKPIRNLRQSERLRTEPDYMLKKRIRNSILKYLKGAGVKKLCSSTVLLGCTHAEFKSYFESKFTEGMTWEIFCNSDAIHIDHIMPVDSYDFNNNSEILKCFHYTNLQPLWKHDNLKKSNKIIP